jgi:V8-like Glu-specific endopeptidase
LKIRRSNGIALCTGFLVGDGLMMTNNHCISDDGLAIEATIEMGYYSRSGVLDRFTVNPTPLLTSSEYDVSLLSVEGSPSTIWGKVSFNPRPINQGEELFIVHHPGGQPKKISRVGCFSGPDQTAEQGWFLHQCDTIGGSSGSPVFDISGNVVGIHHRGTPDRGRDAYNQGTEFVAAAEFIDRLARDLPVDAPSLVDPDSVEDECEREVNGVIVFDQGCLIHRPSGDPRIEL